MLRSPFTQDIPDAFQVDTSKESMQVAGAYAQTIMNFANWIDVDLELMLIDNYKMSTTHKAIERGIYNLSLHPGPFNMIFANITFSYPLEWSKLCVMVPSMEELPRFWYVVQPFGPYIWSLLGICVIYVAICMRILRHPTNNVTHNLLVSLAVTVGSSNMGLKVMNAPFRIQLFYCLLLLNGFVLNGYYNSYLAAYNMRPLFQTGLLSLEDISKVHLPIMVSSNLLETVQQNPYMDLSRIEPLLQEDTQLETMLAMQNSNTTRGFVVTRSDWTLMVKVQRSLIQPKYDLSDICFGDFLYAYPIQLESKFAHNLHTFILLVHQSGLWGRWQEEAFQAALKAKYFRVWNDSYPVDPLNLAYYRFAWIILGGGYVSSVICIMAEKLFYKYQSIERRRESVTAFMYEEDW